MGDYFLLAPTKFLEKTELRRSFDPVSEGAEWHCLGSNVIKGGAKGSGLTDPFVVSADY